MGSTTSKIIYRTGLVILGGSFFISGLLFAQNYSGFGNGGSALPPRSNLNSLMSKDDFKNSVNSLGQQNQQMVKQQVLNSLPKSSIGTPSAGSGTNTMQPPTQAPSTSTYSTVQPSQPTSQPQQPNAPASNSGVYSGFGAGAAPAKAPSNSNSTNSQNSGWNINY